MIRIAAHIQNEDGWGRHARSFAAALSRHERTELRDWTDRPGWLQRRLAGFRQLWSRDSVGIAIGSLSGTFTLGTRCRIAFFVTETTRIPAKRVLLLRGADMVWTPSQWGREVLEANGIAAGRIRVVPEGVDYNTFRPATTRNNSGVFRFLCVGKWEVRKGTADLVRAFCQEFVSGEPVELVMHCGTPWPRALDYRAEIGKIVDESDQPPRVVASDPQPVADLVALMQSSDAFVLPTRGEAWGLPVLEAMACGLPCIVTGYAGLKEFANETNAFLIRVAAMQRVNDPEFYPPQEDWGEWAQPDLNHLRQLMRFVFENRQEARKKAECGLKDAQRWSWENAARTAMAHIARWREK